VSRILLDTHLLLWAVAEPRKLPPGARKRIEQSDVFVSAASLWEVSIKAALGKLVAQAKTEPLLLLTNDSVLAGYGDCVELVAAKPQR
jgi:PIN domain nuclease of toxin-antitoxin system